MGNIASCIAPMTVWRPKTKTATLIWPDGELRRVETSVGVADIMIEAPGHVVTRADEMARTKRVAGMRPDEELHVGEVYLLLPLDRVGSRLSDRQLEVVMAAIGGKMTRKRRKVTVKQVFPVLLAGNGLEVKVDSGLTDKRVIGCRQSWSPKLDTIHEVRYF